MTSHHPVMLREAIEALNIKPDGIYVDATFGRGGHSREILQSLNAKGRLICIDKDPEAIAYAKAHFGHDQRVLIIQNCFSKLAQVIYENGLQQQINGILVDLGVSSPQLETGSRGFSFMRDGPLDMRMDPTAGVSAEMWLNTASQKEIAIVLKKYGEEPNATRIAKKIIESRQQKSISMTLELAAIVSACVGRKKTGHHPATKTFQAIRMHINQELQALECILKNAIDMLAPLARLVLISFHSLEDRKVKQFFRAKSKIKLPPGIALPESELVTPFKWIIKRQRASLNEVQSNPRARSAFMRVAEKNDL